MADEDLGGIGPQTTTRDPEALQHATVAVLARLFTIDAPEAQFDER
jgi:hypothetical protein